MKCSLCGVIYCPEDDSEELSKICPICMWIINKGNYATKCLSCNGHGFYPKTSVNIRYFSLLGIMEEDLILGNRIFLIPFCFLCEPYETKLLSDVAGFIRCN